jgi:hypothetical protein
MAQLDLKELIKIAEKEGIPASVIIRYYEVCKNSKAKTKTKQPKRD